MTPFTLDWYGFCGLLLLTLALTFVAGVEWCRFTHRRRGLEVDRDVTPRDLLPIPPAPTVVPDQIPDWMDA